MFSLRIAEEAFRKLCQENNIAFMALDYKGHGASGGDFKDFTLSDWLEDVLLLLKKINGPYVLMGSSLGGWLAMLAASNVNVKAKALFLLAPAPDFTERILSTLSPVQKKHLNDKDLIEIGEGPLPFTKKLLENGKKYSFLGKGKKGEADMAFFKKALIDPFARGINELNARMETGRYGMVTPQPENDTEYFSGLGVGRYRGDDEYARSILFKHGDYLIPIGKGMGTHTNLISEELRKYYGKVYPDIFASHCTESTFSFLNAGLKKQWLLMKDFILPHQISLDGQSSGFSPAEWQQIHKRPTFDHPYKIESILKRLLIPEAIRSGFGYEECRDILKHDKAQFDDNYHCVNEDLKKFLKSAVFLTQEELNYDTIKYRFID